mgnify:CR=1 FL=1
MLLKSTLISLLVLPAGSAFAGQTPATSSAPPLQASQPILTAPDQSDRTVGTRRAEASESEADNREIEQLRREREAMERQLEELESAGSGSRGSGSGGTPETTNFDPVSPVTDPIEDALAPAGNAIGDAIGGIEDGLGDLLGGSSGDEDLRDATVDHRTGRTPPRRSETVSARRGQLPAPSELVLNVVTPTSIAISWQDNAGSEQGVHVERGTPVRARGGVNYDWRRVFSSEERVESRVRNTGARSDIDDGLVPGTLYCYRLRAYRAEQVSAYTDIACSTPR